MLLFFIKIYRTFRRALSQRKYPHQLAWAIAFGLLLGLIPHGNLLAVATVVLILCLRLNHAAMGLTAIGVTYLAPRMDPYSHRVGQYVLDNAQVHQAVTNAWSWPLVPWTDINNTIVVGSFLIGVALLIPTFAITYPLFRRLAPRPKSQAAEATPQAQAAAAPVAVPADHSQPMPMPAPHAAARVDHPAAAGVPASHLSFDQTRADIAPDPRLQAIERKSAEIEFREIRPDQAEQVLSKHYRDGGSAAGQTMPSSPPVRTRIDVVRTAPPQSDGSNSHGSPHSHGGPHQRPMPADHGRSGHPQPAMRPASQQQALQQQALQQQTGARPQTDPAAMDEALNYLLHQLRDNRNSQGQGEAA